MYDLDSIYPYSIYYYDYDIDSKDNAQMTSDSFDLKTYREMIDLEKQGRVLIERVDVVDPMNPNEYTTIYERK